MLLLCSRGDSALAHARAHVMNLIKKNGEDTFPIGSSQILSVCNRNMKADTVKRLLLIVILSYTKLIGLSFTPQNF